MGEQLAKPFLGIDLALRDRDEYLGDAHTVLR